MKKIILLLILAFSCVLGLTACDKNEQKELSPELKAGQSFVKQLYANAASQTPADYDVISSAAKCVVSWSVKVTQGNPEDVKVVVNEDGTVTIDVNEKAEADVLYTLTATIAYNGETTTLSYERKLPKFKELSYAEYAAKEKDDAVVVKGIVIGILSKELGDNDDCLYLHTPEGGFYVYQIANTEAIPMSQYKLGQEVRASGKFDNYNGTFEVKSATCEILNETPVNVEALDITAAFKAAEDVSLEKIGAKQSMLVTLKDVTISDINADSGYYNFTLGGKKTYMRISSTNCPLNAEDTATFKEEWAAHAGYTADVTGIVTVYSGNFYLQPATLAGAVTYKSLPQLSDEDAVALEQGNLSIKTSDFKDGAKVTLPLAGAAYKDVTITWESNSPKVVIENGVATVTLNNENVDLKLTATIKRGAAELTKEFSFTIFALPVTATQAYAAEKDTQVLVKGVITEIKDASWGNIYISDGKTNYYVYGVYNAEGKKHGEWAEADKLAVGDVITLSGTAGAYNGVPQLAGKAKLISRVKPVALDAVKDLADNTNTVVTGTISEIVSDKYGNLYIKSGENTLYIYGVNNFAGQRHEYWAAEDKLAVGDVVVLEGPKTTHNGTEQLKSATLISVTKQTGSEGEGEGSGSTTPDDGDDTTTIADALAGFATNPDATYVITGIVYEVTGGYNSTNKNMSINLVDSTGLINCFQLSTKKELKQGDLITVTGKVSEYNGKKQIAQGTYVVSTASKTSYIAGALQQKANSLAKSLQGTYTLPTTLSFAGVSVNLTWTNADGAVTEIVYTKPAADTTVTATVSYTYNNETVTKEIAFTLKAFSATSELSFADKAYRTEQTSSKQVWTNGRVTLTNTGSVSDYANPARFYKNSKVTITATNITKIVFTCNTNDYAGHLKTSIGTVTGVTVELSGKVVTLTFASAVNSFEVTLTANQVRMDKMVVTCD